MKTDSPQTDQNDEKSDKEPATKYYKEYGPYVTLGLQLAAAVLVFYFIGSWLDNHYDTGPAFTLAGIMLGTIGGLIKFFKAVLDLNKQSESPKDRQRRES